MTQSHSHRFNRYFLAVSFFFIVFAARNCIHSCPVDGPTAEKEGKTTAVGENERAGQSKHSNRLARESSLYLLMHAHNPVDWYPWGKEALARAKKENKIIFLSVGYSSCRWCHVMERESFMDDEIADFLNKHFVCVKIDREERPDIDSIYMTALHVYYQLAGTPQGGGWPLSMFLLPDSRPFFGGTYFPARDGQRGASTGFVTILKRVQQAWKDNPDAIKRDATNLTRFTKAQLENQDIDPSFKIDQELIDATLSELADQYDPAYGGFGYSPVQPLRPKFPEPSNLLFLIDRVQRTQNEQALQMLIATLERLAMGGIRDHIGGGFHRYSVDRFWHIPHFEKMLYDNGQLATAYAEAYALTGREDFRHVIEELLAFVGREMTSDQHAFYAALDAESEGEEGKYYRWEKADIERLLDNDEFTQFATVYGLDGKPNFEEHFYAPQLRRPLRDAAADHGVSESDLYERLAEARKKLLDARAGRVRPLTDTKILTSWNGLMIRGFADAGRILKNEHYIRAAVNAADFVLANCRTENGQLRHCFAAGEARLNAYLNDYAFLVDGLIALYRATDDNKWLTLADEITAQQIALFWDEKGGGFFFTSADHETLLARAKNPIDGAEPSGNSVAAQNLIFLSKILDRPDYRVKAEETVRSAGTLLRRAPAAAPRLVVAAAQLVDERRE